MTSLVRRWPSRSAAPPPWRTRRTSGGASIAVGARYTSGEGDFRGTVVRGNRMEGNFGIKVDGNAEDNRVEANSIDRAGAIGIDDSGTRSVLTANVMVGQIFPDFPITGAVAGIIVREEASRGRIQANVSSQNADDDIDIDSPATTVTANLANDNADLGIEAVTGVTDGGGNRARGNGNPAQCVGVACS